MLARFSTNFESFRFIGDSAGRASLPSSDSNRGGGTELGTSCIRLLRGSLLRFRVPFPGQSTRAERPIKRFEVALASSKLEANLFSRCVHHQNATLKGLPVGVV